MTVEEGRLKVGVTDKFLDTTIVEQAGGAEAHREGVFVGDPETTGARAAVAASINRADFALATRDVGLVDVIVMLRAIHAEMRMVRVHLNQITDLEAEI